MKMKCANCGSEENVKIWLKNYKDFSCSKCSENVLGRARKAVGIFYILLTFASLALAVFLDNVLMKHGLNEAFSIILAVSAIVIIYLVVFPLGVRVLYKIYNKSI